MEPLARMPAACAIVANSAARPDGAQQAISILNIGLIFCKIKPSPQINFSSTEVAGNVGGLIFVVGSVFIVAVGLPPTILFLFAATVTGCFLAWALVVWHGSHPTCGLPENRITLR
jgi:hypothetical protein